jgi:hypothetical protein
MAQHPTRESSSKPPPWTPKISFNNVNFLRILNYLLFKIEVMLFSHYICPHQEARVTQPLPYTTSRLSSRPPPLSPSNFLSILILSCQVSYCKVGCCSSIILSFSSHVTLLVYMTTPTLPATAGLDFWSDTVSLPTQVGGIYCINN